VNAPGTHADALVYALRALGYQTAFGIPGGGIASIFAALGGRLRVVLSQHEGAAAYMALGQSLATAGRQVGLCFGTSGPGITNLITGVAAAWEEQVPLFVLTGNVSTDLIGKGAAQDAYPGGLDAVAMLQPVTARSVTAMTADQIVPLAAELHHLALRTRRPVHLNVPVNLASLPFVEGETVGDALAGAHAAHESWSDARSWDTAAMDGAIRALAGAERPLVLAGHGIKTSGLGATLAAALTAVGIPALVTSHGKGILADDHPLLMGTFGFAAPDSSMARLESYRPDVLLFLGTDLGETSTAGWSPLLAKPRVKIHVDWDERRFDRVYRVEMPVRAEIACFLARLVEKWISPKPSRPAWRGTTAEERPRNPPAPPAPPSPPARATGLLHPGELMGALADSLPDDALVFADIGNAMAWAIRHLPVRGRQELFVPMALGPMGSGLGAAIGAQASRPDRPVVVLTGDCAMMMHGTEMLTAREAGLPVKTFVLNDGGHGMVEHGLTLLGMPAEGLRFRRRVDFLAFAQALGVRAVRFDDPAALAAFDWRAEWRNPEPLLIDLIVDPAVVPPILSRTRVLGLTERVT
jgi:acetolactate synthase I/II/III large subunit